MPRVPDNSAPEVLTTDAACALMGIGKAKLRQLVDSGDLAVVDLGYRTRRFRRVDLDAFLDRRTVRTGGPS